MNRRMASEVIGNEELALRRRLNHAERALRGAQESRQQLAPAALNLAEAQTVLNDFVITLEYVYGIEEVFCFVVDRSGFAMMALELGPDAVGRTGRRGALAAFRRGEPGDERSDRAQDRLGEVLLSGIRNTLVVGNCLLVVPDGVLHAVPFEMLMLSQEPLGRGPSRCLVPPSRSIYAKLLSRERPNTPRRFVGFAPEFAGRVQGGQDDRRTWWEMFNCPGTLPGARDEVAQVAAILGSTDCRRVTVMEHCFKVDSAGCRYVHVATHGVFETEGDPLYATGLLLDPPRPEEMLTAPGVDDFLQTREMFDLDRPPMWWSCRPARAPSAATSPEKG